jgi:hypothetical protein
MLFPWRRLMMSVVMSVVLCGGRCVIDQEFLATMLTAKVVSLAIPFGAAAGRFIDGHAANRVDCHVWTYLLDTTVLATILVGR